MVRYSGEAVALAIKDKILSLITDTEKIWRVFTSWEEGKQFLAGHCYMVIVVEGERREHASIGKDVHLHQVDIGIYVGISARFTWINNFELWFPDTLLREVETMLSNNFNGAYIASYTTTKDYNEDYSYHIWKYSFTVNIIET